MTNELARPTLRVRGRSFIALALLPEPPVADWLAELDAQVARAPNYFAGKPVLLDLSAARLHGPGLRAFLAALRDRGIRVLGLEGIEAEQLGEHAADFPPILAGGRPVGTQDERPGRAEAKAPEQPVRAEEPPEASSLLINQSVRSGQRVHFLGGDVTVIGAVSSGAEIIAGGSIHVYGALRGRAFAGIAGKSDARIFCRRMEAELLAIAGAYATSDGLAPELRGRPAQAWYDGKGLAITATD